MNEVQPIRKMEDINKMASILLESSYRNWFMFIVGINFGYRISDLLQVKVKDIRNKAHIVVDEGKTKKTRKIKINEHVVKVVNDYVKDKNDDDYLFSSRKGDSHIQRGQAYRILNEAAKQIGLEEIGTHTLRKTFGYHYYKQYKDVVALQKMFNHSSPEITLRYIGIDQDEMDAKMDGFCIGLDSDKKKKTSTKKVC